MRKVLSFLLFVIVLVGSFCFVVYPKDSVVAANMNLMIDSTYCEETLVEYSEKFKNRQPGTIGESYAAEFIKSKLDSICSNSEKFSPVTNNSTVDGIQKFSFVSNFSGQNLYSKNLIYQYKSSMQTNKKVIIACNYDSIAFDYDNLNDEMVFVDSAAVNGSAASVATILSIAKSVQTVDLPYNIEFVLFGAGESGNAGSNFYTKGILPETKENILCMINIDSIAIGKNVYFYVNEIETNFENFIIQNLKSNDQKMKKVYNIHLGKNLIYGENVLGLDYTHIAISSDNVNFMKEEIPTINIFAGEYEDGVIYGKQEFENEELLTYTKNDNIKYINQKYGEEMVMNNLKIVQESIFSLLQDDNFEKECIAAQDSTKDFYAIFGNQKQIAYITMIFLVIIIAVVSYIKMKLAITSYKARLEPEFLSSVISISQNIDKDCVNEEVPKTVSQLIARDIKKDKIVKPKKKK